METKTEVFTHKFNGSINRSFPQFESLSDLFQWDGDEQKVMAVVNAGVERLAQELSYRKSFKGGSVDLIAAYGEGRTVSVATRKVQAAKTDTAKAIQDAILAAIVAGRDVGEALAEAMAKLGIDA